MRKILSLIILGVSVREVSSAWNTENAIFLKKEKEAVAEKDVKNRKRWKESLAKVNDLDRQVQKLSKDFSQTSARAEDLAKEITATSQKIESFGKELATSLELVASLTAAIESSNAKIEALTAHFAEPRQMSEADSNDGGDLTALTKEVNFTVEKVDGLQNQIAGIVASGEQPSNTGKDYRENLTKQESAISQIASRVDTIEREMVLKIYERLDAIDNNLSAKSADTPFGQVTNHHRTVFPESVNEQTDDAPKVDLAEEIRKLSNRIAVLENHTSSYGEKLGALQNSISGVTKRLDNIEDGNPTAKDSSSEYEL